MKKFAKYFGFVAAFMALLAIIFMATPASVAGSSASRIVTSGYAYAFGKDLLKPVAGLVVAFIFVLLGLLASAAASVLEILGKEVKVAKLPIIEICAAVILLIGAILMFAGYSMAKIDSHYIGPAYILSGFFSVIGVVALALRIVFGFKK